METTATLPPPLPAPAPHSSALPSQDRLLAALCHGAMLIGVFIFGVGFIVPLVIFLVKRDESPFVAAHAKEVLNFQISVVLYLICCIPLVIFLVGIPLMLAIGLMGLICPLIGTIRAADGAFFQYPLTIRFV